MIAKDNISITMLWVEQDPNIDLEYGDVVHRPKEDDVTQDIAPFPGLKYLTRP